MCLYVDKLHSLCMCYNGLMRSALYRQLEESLGSEDPGERLASLVRLRERVKQVRIDFTFCSQDQICRKPGTSAYVCINKLCLFLTRLHYPPL